MPMLYYVGSLPGTHFITVFLHAGNVSWQTLLSITKRKKHMPVFEERIRNPNRLSIFDFTHRTGIVPMCTIQSILQPSGAISICGPQSWVSSCWFYLWAQDLFPLDCPASIGGCFQSNLSHSFVARALCWGIGQMASSSLVWVGSLTQIFHVLGKSCSH